jgi:hypothetical protein
MRYTVVWERTAQMQLAACYNAAPVPNAVLNADPHAEGLYSLNVPPLRVLFEVSDADCLVRVVCVGLLP